MSVAALEIPLSEPSLVVVPWNDDVVDPVGFDPRSQYVELFWLNVLGPTATWLDPTDGHRTRRVPGWLRARPA